MNLSINNLQSNYGRKDLINNKNETYVKFNSELDNKKIDEEQDKLDYELYKNSIMIHTAFTYDEFKNNTSMFPPRNAPGIVRKAWRELAEKATTEKEKLQLMGFGTHCSEALNKRNGDLPTNFQGYLDIAEEMTKYVEIYKDCPGVDPTFYEDFKNIANDFESSLKKYIGK